MFLENLALALSGEGGGGRKSGWCALIFRREDRGRVSPVGAQKIPCAIPKGDPYNLPNPKLSTLNPNSYTPNPKS